ncbi:MAG TPA: sulfotransferase [Marmoricola sp.]|nr:sulfotransferase [Marmoricola sp.]
MDRPKVLSIVGPSRSGTTLLSSILGEVPGIYSAGELRWLWGRDLPQKRTCACGEPPDSCPVWSRVVRQSLGVPAEEQSGQAATSLLSELAAAQRRMNSLSRRHRLLSAPGQNRRADASVRTVTAATVDLITAVADVTGAHTVVDASKRPQEAAIVAAAAAFDHYVVHIVRDPRAVVHSWSRMKPPPSGSEQPSMSARRPSKTVLRWLENAVGADLLQRHVPVDRWLYLRYEDFAARPRETVQLILELLKQPAEAPFVDDHTVLLGPQHTLSGNPDRFRTGAVRIRCDEEWRSHMSRRDIALVTAATVPYLRRHGYPLIPSRRPRTV